MGRKLYKQKDSVQTIVVSSYKKLQHLLNLFCDGPLMANVIITTPIKEDPNKDHHIVQLNAGLDTMSEIIDKIDKLNESDDKTVLFEALIQAFSRLRYHSLMRSDALNLDIALNTKKLAPICSEDEFNEFRRVLAPTLSHTLSELPADIIGGPWAGKADIVEVNSGKEYDNTYGFSEKKDRDCLVETATTFFNPLEEERFARISSKFLHSVAYGKQDKAEKLLKIDPKWLFVSFTFTDYSGRIFVCTAYEYAYWAGDTTMCRMLEKYMDAEIAAEMLRRIDAIERIDPKTEKAVGLSYDQNGIKDHSPHFDLTPFKNALKTYIDGYDTWNSNQEWDEIDAAWINVGLEQREVPAHVAQEYCRPDRSFKSPPTFNEAEFPRVLSFYKFNIGRDDVSWFPLGSSNEGLGYDSAAVRGDCDGAVERWSPPAAGVVALDLEAMSALDKVRATDRIQSREILSQLVGCENKMQR